MARCLAVTALMEMLEVSEAHLLPQAEDLVYTPTEEEAEAAVATILYAAGEGEVALVRLVAQVELVTLVKVATLISKGRLLATNLALFWVVVGRKVVR